MNYTILFARYYLFYGTSFIIRFKIICFHGIFIIQILKCLFHDNVF